MRWGFVALVACIVGQVALAGAPISEEMFRDPLSAKEMVKVSPRRRPQCVGPAAWSEIATCMKTQLPAVRVVAQPSAHVQIVADPKLPIEDRGGRVYVQRPDGKWQQIDNEDPNTRFVGESTLVVGKRTLLRIEERRSEVYGDRGMLRMKVAILCGMAAEDGGCVVLPYDCSSFAAGRTTGVVKATIAFTGDGEPEVQGDRSRAGGYCGF